MTALRTLFTRYERNRRFWTHVSVSAPQDCWPWLGKVDADGYGCWEGHRADQHAYALARGGAPLDGPVEHDCGNRRCVNPRHMRETARSS